jgi:hypothetical protein
MACPSSYERIPAENKGWTVAFQDRNVLYYLLRRLNGGQLKNGPVAQLVEQRTENPRVASSTLAWATSLLQLGEIPKWLKGRLC